MVAGDEIKKYKAMIKMLQNMHDLLQCNIFGTNCNINICIYAKKAVPLQRFSEERPLRSKTKDRCKAPHASKLYGDPAAQRKKNISLNKINQL